MVLLLLQKHLSDRNSSPLHFAWLVEREHLTSLQTEIFGYILDEGIFPEVILVTERKALKAAWYCIYASKDTLDVVGSNYFTSYTTWLQYYFLKTFSFRMLAVTSVPERNGSHPERASASSWSPGWPHSKCHCGRVVAKAQLGNPKGRRAQERRRHFLWYWKARTKQCFCHLLKYLHRRWSEHFSVRSQITMLPWVLAHHSVSPSMCVQILTFLKIVSFTQR